MTLQELVRSSVKNPQLDPFLGRMKSIYQAMDQAYAEIARQYGCSCEGCDGNCCTSYFFHYTVAEYLYLAKGFQTLSPTKQQEISHLARKFVSERDRLQAEGAKVDIMCPANENGLCGLYDFRPMICRLHGVPHSYRRPDLAVVRGDGCPQLVPPDEDKVTYQRLDRTPFYRNIARLEQELRQEIGFSERVKMTIVDMIVTMEKQER